MCSRQAFLANVAHEMGQRLVASRQGVWHNIVKLLHDDGDTRCTQKSALEHNLVPSKTFSVFWPESFLHMVPMDDSDLSFLASGIVVLFFYYRGLVSDSSRATKWGNA